MIQPWNRKGFAVVGYASRTALHLQRIHLRRFSPRSEYRLAYLIVSHRLAAHHWSVFPAHSLAALLGPILESCLEAGGVYGQTLALHMHQQGYKCPLMAWNWAALQDNHSKLQRGWLEEVWQGSWAPLFIGPDDAVCRGMGREIHADCIFPAACPPPP